MSLLIASVRGDGRSLVVLDSAGRTPSPQHHGIPTRCCASQSPIPHNIDRPFGAFGLSACGPIRCIDLINSLEHNSNMNHFSTATAARISGLSVHMVNYFCRNGLIVPIQEGGSRRGKRRQFQFGDLVLLRTYKRLLASGVSTKRLTESIRELQKEENWISQSKYLCSNGADLFLTDETGVFDLLSRDQYVFHFILNIRELETDVRTRISSTVIERS